MCFRLNIASLTASNICKLIILRVFAIDLLSDIYCLLIKRSICLIECLFSSSPIIFCIIFHNFLGPFDGDQIALHNILSLLYEINIFKMFIIVFILMCKFFSSKNNNLYFILISSFSLYLIHGFIFLSLTFQS